MPALPKAPATYQQFIKQFPALGKAWDLTAEAGQCGPLDAKSVRLIKLAIAMGAMREGAVHAGVRKALAAGATQDEIDQVIALAAGTLGFPSVVALFSWTRDLVAGPKRRRR
ncbi:MAG: carboxymuconolactone decarboxylase family protein [Planctomycetota bacterium]